MKTKYHLEKISYRVYGLDKVKERANELAENNWRLVSVCMYQDTFLAYFEQEIPEPQTSEPPINDPKVKAIERIVNKKGAFEYVAMVEAIKNVISSDTNKARLIADEYCQDYPFGH